MAKKVDLEHSFRTLVNCAGDATNAENECDFTAALDRAETCLPHLAGYIAYLRRYQQVEAPRLPPIELIFRLAPPMFSARSLKAVEDWLDGASRTERKAYPELAEQLAAARDKLALAVRIWPFWRPTPATHATEAGRQLMAAWVRYGAVEPVSDSSAPAFALRTHPLRPFVGKCGRCGHKESVPLEDLLRLRTCSGCLLSAAFVIVARSA